MIVFHLAKLFIKFAAMKMRILCAATLLCALLCGCSGNSRTVDGSVWNTTFHIIYISPRNLDDSIMATLARVDASLNMFNDSSLLAAVNRGDTTVRADAMLREVLEVSRRVCSLSGGLFDPTVGPLVDLWGFGRKGRELPEPAQAQIDSALALTGILRCSVAPDGRILRANPLTRFNFSAVAKGYGVDCVAATLQRNGVTDYLVEIGGEVATAGRNPHGRPWRVMIDSPEADDEASGGTPVHKRLRVVEPQGRCMATSGNYRNNRTVGGRRVGHTISPVTGRPLLSSTLSATVMAPSCAMADALATAAMAMTDSAAMAMARRIPGVDLLLVVERGGEAVCIATEDFPPAL